MHARRYLGSAIILNQPVNLRPLPSPFKRILVVLTHYDTPKVVRFESKWIATLSLIVKLSLAIGCLFLMFQRNSYQIFDRSPISAVTIKVKPPSKCLRNSTIMRHFTKYNCSQSLYDVNDFILPATENSAISITTRITEIEHTLKLCNNTRVQKKQNNYSSMYIAEVHNCKSTQQCILPPFYRDEYGNGTWVRKVPLCWFRSSKKTIKENYQALDYILFIKNFVEFPQLDLVRDNLASNLIPKDYTENCEYDSKNNSLCPKFRISKILEMVVKKPEEYEDMFELGSLIEIKISWKCNLDRHIKFCKPDYEFHRLDIVPYAANPYDPGSNFLTSRHFFRPNDHELHRIHTTIYNLHIVVSVTGEVGKFDLFQTTTSIGSYLTIFGTGTIVCDLIAAFFTNFKSLKYDS